MENTTLELKEDGMTVIETIPVAPVVKERTLDELLDQKGKYEADIITNQNQIIYFQGEISKLDTKIQEYRDLGAKTLAEKEAEGDVPALQDSNEQGE